MRHYSKYWLIILAIIINIAVYFVVTDYFTPEPEVISRIVHEPVVEVREVVKEVPVIKTITQEVPVVKEVVKEVPIKPRYFESEEELRNWVENNHGLINVGSVSRTKQDPQNDCDDQADRWQKRALEDGYLVSVCPVLNGKVFNTQVGTQKYHVGLWTSIGNNYYYWEPVTGEITKLDVVRD